MAAAEVCAGAAEGMGPYGAARVVAAADGQGDGGAALGVRNSKKPKSMRYNFVRENLSHCLFALSQVD